MKTTTIHKLQLLRDAFRKKEVAYIRVSGVSEEFRVRDLRNLQHTVEFQLDRGGYIAVDPDDIRIVRLHQMPHRPTDEAI